MKISTKELRIQPGKFIEQAASGTEITVTYRGKALAKIVPFTKKTQNSSSEEGIFGLWKDHDEADAVENYVRNIRKGRDF